MCVPRWKEGASVTKSIESDIMELNKRQNELSIQQEQNSARWIKEQEETQNLKPVKMFNETNAVRLAVKSSQDKILLDFFWIFFITFWLSF